MSAAVARALTCFGLLLHATAVAAPEGPRPGDPAPPLELEQLLQAPPEAAATWDALKGKVVVLEFWATWCGPCAAAIPHMNELTAKYVDKGVQFIAITSEKRETVEKFLAKKPIRGWIGLDTDRSAFKAYQVVGIPHTVLVGRDGKVLAVTYPSLVTEQVLDDALAGRPLELPEMRGRAFVAGVDPDEKAAEPPLYQVLIRPRGAGPTGMSRGPGKLTLDGYTLARLCAAAWEVRPQRVVLSGTSSPEQLYTAVIVAPAGREDDVLAMLREALERAFGLRVRRDTREREVHVLTVSEGGLKLSEAASAGSHTSYGGGMFNAAGMTLDGLTGWLEDTLKEPVVDETRLTGRYDLELTWQEGDTESLRKALREQAGLVLTPGRRAIELLLVDVEDRGPR